MYQEKFSISSRQQFSRPYCVSKGLKLLNPNDYTQSPIIKNGPKKNDAEILGKFKERTLSRSKLRNA